MLRPCKIFLASPGDVEEERRSVAEVVEELNRTVARSRGLVLEVVRWETDVHPGYDTDPQAVVTRQIPEMAEHELFIGIMWKRLGTPTPRADSGTVEEFELAVQALEEHERPDIWFYFRKAELADPTDEELEQFLKVRGFRKKVEERGLAHVYDEPAGFRDALREHLTRWLMRGAAEPAPPPQAPAAPDCRVSTYRLPRPTSPYLMEREEELDQLDRAWADDQIKVVSIVGFGGVGKSTLVYRWLNRFRNDNWRGAERVLGWTFHSQGTRERAAATDQFTAEAMRWLGEEESKVVAPWAKGHRLAELLQQHRTLLVLDGFEPLQYPPSTPLDPGWIKDPALRALIRELVLTMNGLCVVTTQLPIADLEANLGYGAQIVPLRGLSQDAGAALLAEMDVHGDEAALKEASSEVGGHPLSLVLLGNYLTRFHGGDVRGRFELTRIGGGESVPVRRVMHGYEKWWSEEGQPRLELTILRILGLFNRPADPASLEVLRRDPPIAGLTDALTGTHEKDWRAAVADLRECDLLADANPDDPDSLDTHPLVREYFGQRLRDEHPEAWREGHSRLFDHLREIADETPETLDEMAPLLSAVAHGCCAGRHAEAFDEVYWKRIHRGYRHHIGNNLGGWGADLAALSSFFDTTWVEPVKGLSDEQKAHVMNEAGFNLRSLGRARDAKAPLEGSVRVATAAECWDLAAIAAGNLSKVHLTLGNVPDAVRAARESVELADRADDLFWRIAVYTWQADALHQAGELAEAEDVFRRAEALHREREPDFPLLYSFEGFRYCELLLGRVELALARKHIVDVDPERGEVAGADALGAALDRVEDRATRTLAREIEQARHFELALDHLTLGRVAMYRSLLLGPHHIPDAREHIHTAVAGLQERAQQHYLFYGLLAQATLERLQRNWDEARVRLEQVLDVARRDHMRLHEVDCYLGWTRLSISRYHQERRPDYLQQARAFLGKAKPLLARTGYNRRAEEARALEQLVAGLRGGHAPRDPQ